MIKSEMVPLEVKHRLRAVLLNGECDEAVAIAAALSAWPGMLTERRARCDAVVLPYNLDADLPQETHND